MAKQPAHLSKKGSALAERGSAAAVAATRRRPHYKSEWADGPRPRKECNYAMSFYATDSRRGFKLSGNGALVMCFCFIAIIVGLHVLGRSLRSQSSSGQF